MRGTDRKQKISILTQNQMNIRTVTCFVNLSKSPMQPQPISCSETATIPHLEKLGIANHLLLQTWWFLPPTSWLLVLLFCQSGVHKFHEYFRDIKALAYVADIACITDQRTSCICHLLTGEIQSITGLYPLRILHHHGFTSGTRDATLLV